ncbi:hypothetical protein KFE25_012668 [Diacronema lutheri]|uniref:Uncharacterized protein n=1 Tax=Diacronema lutheri TaxID=2081491 RepID=A0A7R9YHE8_DIALT|nr:hypothetical protein KFE25_012668 [Diacronema lutheri]
MDQADAAHRARTPPSASSSESSSDDSRAARIVVGSRRQWRLCDARWAEREDVLVQMDPLGAGARRISPRAHRQLNAEARRTVAAERDA